MIFPTIFGVLITFFQVFMISRYEDWDLTLDNKINAVYAIFVAIWASLFTVSWTNKETIISFLWQAEGDIVDKDDERTEEFKFNWVFNDIT